MTTSTYDLDQIPPAQLQHEVIEGDFIEIYGEVRYRGKTNSYVKETRYIQMIVDAAGNVVREEWEKDWFDAAPGIQTRNPGEGKRSGKSEHWIQQAVRIYKQACPVHIHITNRLEYIDYDGQFNSDDQTSYWIRYF